MECSRPESSISFLDCHLFKILSCYSLLAVDEILTFKTFLGIGGNRVYEKALFHYLNEKYNNFNVHISLLIIKFMYL